jgi:hypothetical protein
MIQYKDILNAFNAVQKINQELWDNQRTGPILTFGCDGHSIIYHFWELPLDCEESEDIETALRKAINQRIEELNKLKI